MSMWRCPHCGVPQAETARCWVCRRSSTTCSTCRHFRRSVAAQLGYCGLDGRRLPLAGTEMLGCWDAAPARATDAVPAAEAPDGGRRQRGPSRNFVPVEFPPDEAAPAAGPPNQVPIAATDLVSRWTGRITLFGEPEA